MSQTKQHSHTQLSIRFTLNRPYVEDDESSPEWDLLCEVEEKLLEEVPKCSLGIRDEGEYSYSLYELCELDACCEEFDGKVSAEVTLHSSVLLTDAQVKELYDTVSQVLSEAAKKKGHPFKVVSLSRNDGYKVVETTQLPLPIN